MSAPIVHELVEDDDDRPSVITLPGVEMSAKETQAEQVVIGSMIVSPAARTTAALRLQPSNFFHNAHRELFKLIMRMDSDELPVSLMTVISEMPESLIKLVHPTYVHTLYAMVISPSEIDYHVDQVLKASSRWAGSRLSIRIASLAASNEAYNDSTELVGLVQDAVERFEDETTGSTAAGPILIGDGLEEWLAEKLDGQPPVMLSTGLADLDNLTGVRPGELLVVAARPSIGKTLLALQFAIHTAIQGKPVLIFSLEMDINELRERLVSQVCRVEYSHIRDKTLTADDQRRIAERWQELSELPVYVEDASSLTMTQIRAIARDYKRRHHIELTLIDYLGLVTPSLTDRNATRERQVADMSRTAKVMGKELQLAVVLVVQLNRESTKRGDPTPRLEDMRESGSIEADANQVWILHRPEFGATTDQIEADPDRYRPGQVQIIVAKNRGGRVGDRWFTFRPHYQSISDMAA